MWVGGWLDNGIEVIMLLWSRLARALPWGSQLDREGATNRSKSCCLGLRTEGLVARPVGMKDGALADSCVLGPPDAH